MNSKRKISCFMVFTLLIISTCCYIPKVKAADSYGSLIADDFETGINGWGPRGENAEEVTLSTEQAHSGEYSLKVSNRKKTWHGATCNKTEELTLGETYVFGIWIKYVGDSYSGTQKFSLQLQYNDGVSDQYKTIKSSSVTKGNWTYLGGEYTIPTDAAIVYIYVETEYKSSPSSQDLMDFYLDDFTATPAQLPEIETDIPSLKDVYSGYFDIGGAATASDLAPSPAKDLILKHYKLLTPGNELKPDAVLDYSATIAYLEEHPEDKENPQVNIRAARTILEFARDNNIPVRGHTLVWHNQTPDWFFRENYSTDASTPWASKEVMLKRMENYIKNVMELLEETYPTVEFYAWDVVNEAVDSNTSTGMRNPGSPNTTPGNSLWMQTIGPEYIEKAFEYARMYTPEGCKLYYNDYNEYEDKKSTFIFNILNDLKEKGLVDGMGMQSHWIMNYPSISMFENAVRKYDSLGLEIQLTELDIKQPDNSENALAAHANRYKLLMNKVVDLREEGLPITAVIFWGVTDRTSWIGGYPLLFDGQYKAKPAFYSIIEGMEPGGTVTPIPTVAPTLTPIPTAIPTVAPTLTPIPTAIPTVTPTMTPIPTVTPSPTAVPTVAPTVTPVPTAVPTVTPTVTPTQPPMEGKPSVAVVTKSNGNSISQKYTLTSVDGTIDLSKVTITFTADGMSSEPQNVWCDQVALQLNKAPWYVDMNGAVSGRVTDKVLTLEIIQSKELGEEEGSMVMDIRFAKSDWTAYGTLTNPVLRIYYDGELVN